MLYTIQRTYIPVQYTCMYIGTSAQILNVTAHDTWRSFLVILPASCTQTTHLTFSSRVPRLTLYHPHNCARMCVGVRASAHAGQPRGCPASSGKCCVSVTAHRGMESDTTT